MGMITKAEYIKLFRRGKLNIPQPQSDAEFEIISEYIFGTPLHLRHLEVYETSASYEIEETYGGDQDKTDRTIGRAVHNSSYAVSHRLWAAIFGELFCGGIARASYGQTRFHGYRHKKRLERWICSRREGSSISVRPVFARLAARSGGGMNNVHPVFQRLCNGICPPKGGDRNVEKLEHKLNRIVDELMSLCKPDMQSRKHAAYAASKAVDWLDQFMDGEEFTDATKILEKIEADAAEKE